MQATGECRSTQCSARIIWAVTARGKNMPVDAEPAADGNVMITYPDGDGTTPVATVVNPDAPPLEGWAGTLHHSHFETCPAAGQFRPARRSRP